MSLPHWLDNKWLISVEPTVRGVSDLIGMVARDIRDASLSGISTDGRFEHSYDAVRCLAELALYAAGYKIPKGGRKHERLIQSLAMTVDGPVSDMIDYLDRCRRLRHQLKYERSGLVQQADANRLLEIAGTVETEVLKWLRKNHSRLMQ